ncbi:DNA mismatch repair endonuclease MutL [Desulfuromonas sp. AOP6]|uniref:DNA mismatch repair endonuclease MutL n=1 Tax=Desulfuromonas sp. AOP6 TaxID=1566351 RepID=UPI00127A9FE6|nr:DNA mismatch repair endonuclease MutL [Desulfuromonas sp. AOP6]BCA80048.1 DNA mismatch repair protein MutL [Desulfuromonas sp. AOP6]
MKHRIQLLPEKLCNQIAAGEVVERPSSVVKELVENSLDAGATEVRVEVEKGGRSLIRIVDNGSGMGREDAFLSLERHATSKIRTDEDLFAIRTLGFRGEALPSIAAVSRLTLRTREEDSLEGSEIYLEGGTVRRADAIGMPRGTTIEVRNLFFNLPARRKFLRREETELGHIGDVVTKMALARPDVQFKLSHNGRVLLDVYRHDSLRQRALALLGKTLASDLVAVEGDGQDLKVTGLVSQPSSTRSTTSAMFAFVNGRYVRDRVIQHAILDGYRNLLLKGRYPVVVLFIEMDPQLVDVNVHPTKHEVRFREQSLVHDFIAATVRDALRPAAWLKEEPRPEIGRDARAPWEDASRPISSPLPPGLPLPAPSSAPRFEAREVADPFGSPSAPALSLPEKNICRDSSAGFFSSLILIGQFGHSYLLCQEGDDLILIDQHAAHERIGFERLKSQLRQGKIERQALLFPDVLEFDFRQAALVQEHLDDLQRLGFEMEPFGGNSFVLKAVPQLLHKADPVALLRDVAGELAQIGQSDMLEEALDQVLILMACHTMVRANQKLSLPQMQALLNDMDTVDFKGHCPHGRPVMQRLSRGEIEKMFKRT